MNPVISHTTTAEPDSLVSVADHDHPPAWLNELAVLLWRFAGLGIGQDVSQMDVAELHGVYRYLARIDRQSRT